MAKSDSQTRKLTIISPRLANDLDVYINLFGEIKITTSKGVLTEHELKSPKVARLTRQRERRRAAYYHRSCQISC